MKKYIFILLVLIIGLCIPASAEETEMKKMSVTCYILKGTTYSGTETRPGVCATDKAHLGKIAVVYLIDEDGGVGECIGTYSCEDLIGTEAGQKGYVIDLWRANLTQAKNTMRLTGGKCWVEFIDGEG